MVSLLLRAAVICAAVHIANGAGAQAPAAAANAELTLAQAVQLALARNPDLRASLYELTAARGRIVQAGLHLNPEIDVELENFAGTGSVRGTAALETTLRVSQVIELGGKRDRRVAVAERNRDAIGLEQRARELDVLSDVTRSFIAVVAAQEKLLYTQQGTALAQRTFEAITQRVQAARSPVAEQSRARIAVTRALLDEQHAGSELRAARALLVALWGDAEPTFGSANGDLFRFEDGRTFESLFEAVQRSPDFLAFASEARLRDAELQLARAEARPNLAASVGIRRLEAGDDYALVAGFSKQIAIRNRNQGAILEAQARRAQTDAEQRAALVRVRATLFSLYQGMAAARARALVLRDEAVPQAQTALSQTQAGYDVGRFSFLELVTAQQELLELQQAAVAAATDYQTLGAELERLTSEPLSSPLPETPEP